MKQTIRKILMAVLSVMCVGTMLFAVACGEEPEKPVDSGKASVEISQSASAAPVDSSAAEIDDSSVQEVDDSSAQEIDDSSAQEIDDSSAQEIDDSSADSGKVVISFDPNGGTLTGETSFTVEDDGYFYEEPDAPTREGYKFLGWFTGREDGEEIDFWEVFTESVTYYAHWAEAYTVTFNANGGTLNGSATVTVVKGSTIAGAPTAVKAGSDFHGWFTEAEGGDQIQIASYKPEANVTLYAHYGAFTMPIKTLNNAGGTKIGYRIEAENSKVVAATPSWNPNAQDGFWIETNKPNASGSSAIGSLNTAGNTVTFTFRAAAAGSAKFTIVAASNASQGTASTNVGTSIFTVAVNGNNVNFTTQTVQGGTTYSDRFDPVVIGTVNVTAGVNSVVLTVVNANSMTNLDCLDIETSLTLTSADGTAASGTAVADYGSGGSQGGGTPATGAYAKAVDAKVVVGTYDDGPRVDKVILGFTEDIASSAVTGSPFTVTYNNGNLGGTASYYLCDEKGNRVATSTSRYVAVEYGGNKNNRTNPFNYNSNGGYNAWKDVSTTTVTFNNFTIGGTSYSGAVSSLTKDYYVPSLDKWDLTGKHVKDGVTLNYGTYTPEVPAGEKRPVIVWLHGQGEGYSERAGVDIRTTLLGNKVTPLAENPIQSYFDGAFVIAPQAPTYWMNTLNGGSGAAGSYSRYFAALEELLRTYVESDPQIDASRVYVGGCSNGGWCTLEVVSRMGDFFAGCYPVCAPYNRAHFSDEMFANLVKVPMWIVHANNDGTVTLNNNANSKALYMDLLNAGKTDLYFSLFANNNVDGNNYNGHFSWIWVFRDEVNYVQALTGSGTNGAFTGNDFNPNSTLTVQVDGETVNMWQWLATFTNEGALSQITYGVIGSMGGNDWTNEIRLRKQPNGTYRSAAITFVLGDEFKIRSSEDEVFPAGDSSTNFKITEEYVGDFSVIFNPATGEIVLEEVLPDPTMEISAVSLAGEGGRAYLVLTYNYAGMTAEEAVAYFDSYKIDFENTSNWSRSLAGTGFVKNAENGVMTMKYDITDLNAGRYNTHYGYVAGGNGNPPDFNPPFAVDYTITVGSKNYNVTVTLGGSNANTFWGNIGIIVSNA